MILPVYAYGHPVLKKMGSEIDPSFDGLDALIEDMWETMYYAKGVGLAAPQVGHAIRLFVVDTIQIQEEGEEEKGIKKVFINAQKVEETGNPWAYEEGCLSIPEVLIKVKRAESIVVVYMDENNRQVHLRCNGLLAKVIQHETDHLNGKLIVDYASLPEKVKFKKKLDILLKMHKGAES